MKLSFLRVKNREKKAYKQTLQDLTCVLNATLLCKKCKEVAYLKIVTNSIILGTVSFIFVLTSISYSIAELLVFLATQIILKAKLNLTSYIKCPTWESNLVVLM